VDEDPPHGIARRELAEERVDPLAPRTVDRNPIEQRAERLAVEPAVDQRRVHGIDERIGFPVVAEQILRRVVRRLEPATEELGQLVADLLAKTAELPAHEDLQLILEDDAVDLDAVERELVADRAPDLRRARRNEVDERPSSAPSRRVADAADQLRHPGDRDLVLGALEGNADEIAQPLELRPEIGLVEVPAKDRDRGLGPSREALPPGARSHREPVTISAISLETPSRTPLAATLTAFAIARELDRSCALMKRFWKPRIGEPP
jgi:hypothetical protein